MVCLKKKNHEIKLVIKRTILSLQIKLLQHEHCVRSLYNITTLMQDQALPSPAERSVILLNQPGFASFVALKLSFILSPSFTVRISRKLVTGQPISVWMVAQTSFQPCDLQPTINRVVLTWWQMSPSNTQTYAWTSSRPALNRTYLYSVFNSFG